MIVSTYLKFKTKESNFHKIWYFLVDELERELDPRSTISCKNDLIQRVSRKHSGTETSI